MIKTKRNGNTATLVRHILQGAKDSGATVTEVFLPDFKLEFCTGCLRCTARGECPLTDRFEDIRKLVYAADGIILGSPTYASDYNATMKNFFERLGPYTLYTSSLGGKYFVGVSTSNGKAAKKTAAKLVEATKMGIFKRAFVTGTLGIPTISNKIEIKVENNPAALEKARKLGSKLTDDIRRNKNYPFQNLLPRIVVCLQLKPFFRTYILRNKDGKEKATYENLSSRGLI